jgi:hypothetical protein
MPDGRCQVPAHLNQNAARVSLLEVSTNSISHHSCHSCTATFHTMENKELLIKRHFCGQFYLREKLVDRGKRGISVSWPSTCVRYSRAQFRSDQLFLEFVVPPTISHSGQFNLENIWSWMIKKNQLCDISPNSWRRMMIWVPDGSYAIGHLCWPTMVTRRMPTQNPDIRVG